jgi:phage baseplate assembly protein W
MVNVVETAISFPFSISPTGSVQVTTSQEKIWADKVLSVIGTRFNERIYRSTFGSQVPNLSFENLDSIELDSVIGEISNAFAENLPTLQFRGVDSNVDFASGTVTLSVKYKLPNQTLVNTSLDPIILNGNYPPQGAN